MFADYPLEARAPRTDLAANAPVLTFSLGGASKTLGLPQVKLGWIVVGGPDAERARRSTVWSTSPTPTCRSARRCSWPRARCSRRRGRARRRSTPAWAGISRRAREIAAGFPACTVLPVEGGWTAVVRVPALRSEEALALSLLEHEHVLVHPGYFFDFDTEAFLVVSLLLAGRRVSRCLRAHAAARVHAA